MADGDMTVAEASTDGMLVTRRSKRSTAGNRMEAVLAELDLETNRTEELMEEDVDFVNDKDEQDEFGSDFASTDEEEAAQEEAEGEKAVQEEERRVRKEARSRLDKVTAAAHAKHRVTFNPQAHAPSPAPKPKPKLKRVSMGSVVNAETGESLLDGEGAEGEQASSRKQRHSQRKHTILNTSETVSRQKRSEEKKAATPKKIKTITKMLSQAELIALALDNEEGNIIEHRDYLRIEEEKRRKARVVRTTVTGPLIRWVSRGEEVKITVPAPAPPAPSHPAATAPFTFTYSAYGASGSTPYGLGIPFAYSSGTTAVVPSATPSVAQTGVPNTPLPSTVPSSSTSTPLIGPSSVAPVVASGAASTPTSSSTPQTTASQSSILVAKAAPTPNTASIPTLQAQTQQPPTSLANPYLAQLQATSTFSTTWPYIFPVQPQPPTPPIERTEKVACNYVVQEIAQYDGAPKPSWTQTMTGMFGDHVKWDELKVYVGKSRPLSRPKQTCPITGLQAKYVDPRTGVPYADLKAYRVLTDILKHEYIWSPALKCYVGKTEHQETEDSNAMVS